MPSADAAHRLWLEILEMWSGNGKEMGQLLLLLKPGPLWETDRLRALTGLSRGCAATVGNTASILHRWRELDRWCRDAEAQGGGAVVREIREGVRRYLRTGADVRPLVQSCFERLAALEQKGILRVAAPLSLQERLWADLRGLCSYLR